MTATVKARRSEAAKKRLAERQGSHAAHAPYCQHVSAAEEEELRHLYPASFFIPNIGQEKATLPLKEYTGGVCRGAFFGGNGVGKTTALCATLVGLCCGKMQLHRFYDDWKVFDWADGIRRNEHRPLRVRLICHQSQMAEDGNLYLSLMRWFPKGWVTWSKNQKSYYNMGEVKNPADPDTILAMLQVRTFDQERVAHASDTLDVILSDEPFEKRLWSENVGRIRRGGIIWIFCTPLEVGGWLKDQFEGRADFHFTKASIWDNCADWHPDSKLIGKTRGVLLKADIDAQLREWDLEGPEVRKARELGEFTHLAGQVLKEWDPEVHVIEPFPIPASWPIYRIMDPSNGGKPDFVSWWAQSPDDRFYCVAEYPKGKWIEETKKSGESVSRACANFRDIEAPFRRQVVYSFADPALFKFQSRTGAASTLGISNGLNVEFSAEGFDFVQADNDPKVGLSKLREMLSYDLMKPVDEKNKPHLMVFRYNPWTGEEIKNTATAPGQWCYKRSNIGKGNGTSFTSAVEEEWKDPVDCMRYLVTKISPFSPVKGENFMPSKEKVRRINRSARW